MSQQSRLERVRITAGDSGDECNVLVDEQAESPGICVDGISHHATLTIAQGGVEPLGDWVSGLVHDAPMKRIVGGHELFDVPFGQHLFLPTHQVVKFCEEWIEGPR